MTALLGPPLGHSGLTGIQAAPGDRQLRFIQASSETKDISFLVSFRPPLSLRTFRSCFIQASFESKDNSFLVFVRASFESKDIFSSWFRPGLLWV